MESFSNVDRETSYFYVKIHGLAMPMKKVQLDNITCAQSSSLISGVVEGDSMWSECLIGVNCIVVFRTTCQDSPRKVKVRRVHRVFRTATSCKYINIGKNCTDKVD